jgi:hypothetical protein
MDAKVAVLEVVVGAGVAFLIIWALAWREYRRSKPKSPNAPWVFRSKV